MRKVFYKMVIANTFILSFALTKWYQLSPICAADGPPFLSRKELRSARFPCVSFSVLKFYKRIFLFTPAICKDCTVPRIRSGFLPTYEPWLIPTCESSDSHRQQTKFAAFILSLQNGKRAASFPFAKLLHTCFFKREHSASRLKSQFSSLKSVFFPRHSLTQFSNLSFLIPLRLEALHSLEPQACCPEARKALPIRKWHNHSCRQQTWLAALSSLPTIP